MANSYQLRIGNFQGPIAPSSVNNLTLSGSGIAVAWVVDARTTEAISKIRFRYGARTGTPPTYVVTIEGIDGSGNPNGTDKGGASPTAKTFTPPASTAWDGLTQEITLTNPYTPASNDEIIVITIRYSSGTIDAGNCSSITTHYNGGVAGTRGYPFHATLSGGTWTKQTVVGLPNVAWVSTTRTHGFVVQSLYSTTTSTVGNRSAAIITLPSGVAGTTTVTGVHMVAQFSGAGGSSKVCIWSAANSVLASRTIDGDHTTGLSTGRAGLIEFTTPVTLTNGTKYYIGIECNAIVATGLYGIGFAVAADMQGLPNGDNVGLATYNGTTWTESLVTYPLLELITSDISPASSGGGAILIGPSALVS